MYYSEILVKYLNISHIIQLKPLENDTCKTVIFC